MQPVVLFSSFPRPPDDIGVSVGGGSVFIISPDCAAPLQGKQKQLSSVSNPRVYWTFKAVGSFHLLRGIYGNVWFFPVNNIQSP